MVHFIYAFFKHNFFLFIKGIGINIFKNVLQQLCLENFYCNFTEEQILYNISRHMCVYAALLLRFTFM